MIASKLRSFISAGLTAGLILALMLVFAPASALVTFDFETPYLVHPGQQVWDFSLIEDGGQYHAFYHTIAQHNAHPAQADTIWHAVSQDLSRWEILGPVLTSGPGWYDEVAMWAPDVVYDEATGRWAMLYTGVAEAMVQRPCLAWSDDLMSWTKSVANPVFEPDTLTYHWAPDQAWSSFRDPFVYHDGAQWNMLSTAGLRLGGYPGYRRGIVHRAVSADLTNWSDAGVFYEHDGIEGKTRDLESVQYVVREGWHHLFFVEQNLALDSHPTSHLAAADPASWTMANRTDIDHGWAPEIKHFGSGEEAGVFARLAKGQDPRDGSWFVTVRFDSLRFSGGGQVPEVVFAEPFAGQWPTRFGTATAPTFGENAVLRHDPPQGVAGHGWFSTYERYGGPLSGSGSPGAAWGAEGTARLESQPFTITGDHLRLLLGGGYYAETCYVALVDDLTGLELSRIHTNNMMGMAERLWDLRPWLGRTVRLAIVDEETRTGGWIAVDGIEERVGSLATVPGLPEAESAVSGLIAWPNPFNPQTLVQYEIAGHGASWMEIYDVAGRRVWQSPRHMAQGESQIIWNGCDQSGRSLSSGSYLGRIMLEGEAVAQVRLVLLK